jgi:hypothetical protein
VFWLSFNWKTKLPEPMAFLFRACSNKIRKSDGRNDNVKIKKAGAMAPVYLTVYNLLHVYNMTRASFFSSPGTPKQTLGMTRPASLCRVTPRPRAARKP